MHSWNTFKFIKFYTNLEYLSNVSTYGYISLCDDCLVKCQLQYFRSYRVTDEA